MSVTKDHSTEGYKLTPIQRFVYMDGSPTQNATVQTETRVHQYMNWLSTTSEYDGAGRLVRKTDHLGGGSMPDAVTSYGYDASGNLTDIEVPDPQNPVSGEVSYTTQHDSLGRAVESRAPDGSGVRTTYSGRSTTQSQLSSTSADTLAANRDDAPLAQKVLQTDGFGRLVRVKELVSEGEFATTQYEYDVADRMVRIVDAENNVTTLHYDLAGRRTEIVRGEKVWSYSYDLHGNMTLVVPPAGAPEPGALSVDHQTSIAYDALDRVTSRMTTSGIDDEAIGSGVTTYVYDGCEVGSTCAAAQLINAKGRLTQVQLPFATIVYEYDARGNPITEQRKFWIPGQRYAGFGDTRTVRRTYTDHGAVWADSHADGDAVAQSWTMGEETSSYLVSNGATLTMRQFDRRGLPDGIGWLRGSGFTPLAYVDRDRSGLPVFQTLVGSSIPSGSSGSLGVDQTRTWRYDVLGRVTEDMLQRPSRQLSDGTMTDPQSPLALVSYYDTGDVRSLTSYLGHTIDYAYDARHQLVRAREEVAPGQYVESNLTYTLAGRIDTAKVQGATNGMNMVRERDVTYQYSDDPSNPEQLDALHNASGSGTYASFRYNARGATTKRVIHNPVDQTLHKVWDMQYDGDGRLRILTRPQPSHGSEVYYYDHTGQRMLALERTESGDPIKLRVWIGGTEIHYDASNNETKTRAHVALGGPVARIENRTDVEFTFHDGLGHLVLATTPDGADKVAYSYTAFGEVYDHVGDAQNHLRRFNGKEVDPESGLAYYGWRYYDPVAMQWGRADPLYRFTPDAASADPRRGNLYVFSLNNAIRYLDPHGLDGQSKDRAASAKQYFAAQSSLWQDITDQLFAWERDYNISGKSERIGRGMIAVSGTFFSCVGSAGALCYAAAGYFADDAQSAVTGGATVRSMGFKAMGVNPQMADLALGAVLGVGGMARGAFSWTTGTRGAAGPAHMRIRTGPSGELRSVFAKIEPGNIGKGTGTNVFSRRLARRLGNATDDAGHAIGRKLGGRGGARSGNIFPQAPSVNRGAFAQFERQIARRVMNGDSVFVRVVPRYRSGSTRPFEILYQARINGRTVSRTFPNP